MTILVTGCAGFIGSAVCQPLLERGERVVGVDNLNDYYDPRLKFARLDTLKPYESFQFIQADLADQSAIADIFSAHTPLKVINLAAQAGVRYSLENPKAYIDSNIVGFANILEMCRQHEVAHLVYASSSSVYGDTGEMPFSTEQRTDRPVSLYAASKKSNELMAHSYSHLYGIPMTGLRYFTVYGPWGRPDMAPFKFTQRMLAGEAIPIYNHGKHRRDFTYIDDIVNGTIAVLDRNIDTKSQDSCYQLMNIGYGSPVSLMEFIELLEKNLGITAKKEYLAKQPGDVEATWADISTLKNLVNYQPRVSLAEGISHFVAWYKNFYGRN